MTRDTRWMNPALSVFVPVLALSLGCSSKSGKPRQGEGGKPAGMTVAAKPMGCADHLAAIRAQAPKAARCKVDGDCRIVPLAVCAIKGLGCHWGALNPAHAAALNAAIAAYLRAPCMRTKCECQKHPKKARCQKGRCVAVPLGS